MTFALYAAAMAGTLGLLLFLAGLLAALLAQHPRGRPLAIVGLVLWLGSAAVGWWGYSATLPAQPGDLSSETLRLLKK
ncbi:hypothetical protein ACM25O_13310 [Sulfitobacter pontiacus]